jgi:hypothetical protein
MTLSDSLTRSEELDRTAACSPEHWASLARRPGAVSPLVMLARPRGSPRLSGHAIRAIGAPSVRTIFAAFDDERRNPAPSFSCTRTDLDHGRVAEDSRQIESGHDLVTMGELLHGSHGSRSGRVRATSNIQVLTESTPFTVISCPRNPRSSTGTSFACEARAARPWGSRSESPTSGPFSTT